MWESGVGYRVHESRLWPGIEGWVNRWLAGGSHSSARGVKPCVRVVLTHASWKPRTLRHVGGCASWRRRTSSWEKPRLLRVWAPQHQRFEFMDAQSAYLHHPRPGLHRGRHLDRRLLQPPPHPHQPRRQIPHRIRTTPSGLDNSRINKPSTTCAQPHNA